MSTIAISGYAHSGKDTLAGYLCEMLPDARLVSFAKPLKELVYRLYPNVNLLALTDEASGPLPPSPAFTQQPVR